MGDGTIASAAASIPPARRLLLFLDFDGTLAPIASHPSEARIGEGELSAISRLARSGAEIFIVSGRGRGFLSGQIRIKGVRLVPNHALSPLPKRMRKAFSSARRALSSLSRDFPGSLAEEKPSSLSFHFRNVRAGSLPSLRRRMRSEILPLLPKGARTMEGKKITEFIFSRGSKGEFARRQISRNRNSYPVAIGDDTTDEGMFAAVRRAGGLSVKVGRGKTCARVRLESQAQAKALLLSLLGK